MNPWTLNKPLLNVFHIVFMSEQIQVRIYLKRPLAAVFFWTFPGGNEKLKYCFYSETNGIHGV